MIARAALLAVLFTVGCGDIMYRYNQSTASAALAAMACKETLSEATTKKLAACGKLLKPDATVDAQACLDTWRAQYEKIDLACKALRAGAKIALDSGPVVAAAASKKTDALGWIARLAKLAVDVAATFSQAGLTFGGAQ